MRSRTFLAGLAVALLILSGTPGRAASVSETVSWAPKQGGDPCKGMPLGFTGPGILMIRLQMDPYQEREFPGRFEDVIQGTGDLAYFAHVLGTTINGGPPPSTSMRGRPVDRVSRWEVKLTKPWGLPLSLCPPVSCNPGGCTQYGSTATVTVEFTGAVSPVPSPTPASKPPADSSTPVPGAATVENDTDRAGSDYRKLANLSDPRTCRARCDADPRCKAYVWVKPGVQGPTGICYLKDPAPKATASSCCVSGVKIAAPSPPASRPTAALVNHALASAGATAAQSSTYSGSCSVGAEFAIDGVTDAGIASGCKTPITHTQSESKAWWRVELAAPRVIQQIVIWNRNDVAKERLSNFTVSVIGANGTVVFSKDLFTSGGFPDPSITIPLPSVTGKRVQVQLRGSNYLSLAEVQVFGPAS